MNCRAGLAADPAATAARTPRSADVHYGGLVRLAAGGIALAVLDVRHYGLRRTPVLGPTGRLAATGVTVFTGSPFLPRWSAAGVRVPTRWCRRPPSPAWCCARTSSP